MKRALVMLCALTMVITGVAGVSAYEAHTINVVAHVEDAMWVSTRKVDFGTVFPEEWLIKKLFIQTSESFCELGPTGQYRVGKIYYSIYAGWKPKTFDPTSGEPTSWYPWLGKALYVDIGDQGDNPLPGDMTYVGANQTAAPGVQWVMDCPMPLNKFTSSDPATPKNMEDYIILGLDVPVFEGYYNQFTDPKTPSYEILKTDPEWNPDGVDLGIDIIIQVTHIEP
jgi:hypothetical protein